MNPRELNRLARMCEAARARDPDLGRAILIDVAGWRVDGRDLRDREGRIMSTVIGGEEGDKPTPPLDRDPTGSVDACRYISRWPLVAACDAGMRCTVELAGGYVGNGKTLELAYAAALCRARAVELEVPEI